MRIQNSKSTSVTSVQFLPFIGLAFVIIAAIDPCIRLTSYADEPPVVPEKSSTGQSSLAKLSNQDELEKRFQDMLTGATLQGHFTSNRSDNGVETKEDKYSITSVKKVQGDVWLFNARIQYGTHDVTLPLPLRVVWAGDTPVITLDRVPVPGMGSFTARVMIFDGKYAGMWDGGDHGGLLYGKLTKDSSQDRK
ncbi:MAG TPA: hypothetical protein VFE46_17275 [Pirellulales bacterium]|jgi:hypothetical protein|nr:hypothetical protein [Pirellulales bacterium]